MQEISEKVHLEDVKVQEVLKSKVACIQSFSDEGKVHFTHKYMCKILIFVNNEFSSKIQTLKII